MLIRDEFHLKLLLPPSLVLIQVVHNLRNWDDGFEVCVRRSCGIVGIVWRAFAQNADYGVALQIEGRASRIPVLGIGIGSNRGLICWAKIKPGRAKGLVV